MLLEIPQRQPGALLGPASAIDRLRSRGAQADAHGSNGSVEPRRSTGLEVAPSRPSSWPRRSHRRPHGIGSGGPTRVAPYRTRSRDIHAPAAAACRAGGGHRSRRPLQARRGSGFWTDADPVAVVSAWGVWHPLRNALRDIGGVQAAGRILSAIQGLNAPRHDHRQERRRTGVALRARALLAAGGGSRSPCGSSPFGSRSLTRAAGAAVGGASNGAAAALPDPAARPAGRPAAALRILFPVKARPASACPARPSDPGAGAWACPPVPSRSAAAGWPGTAVAARRAKAIRVAARAVTKAARPDPGRAPQRAGPRSRADGGQAGPGPGGAPERKRAIEAVW